MRQDGMTAREIKRQCAKRELELPDEGILLQREILRERKMNMTPKLREGVVGEMRVRTTLE